MFSFEVASAKRQSIRQKRVERQYKKLETMNEQAIRNSLIKRKLIRPTSKAPVDLLREIAAGIFIDGNR